MEKQFVLPEGMSYINPLFWQKHESEEVLREEIRKMKSVNIGEFVVEPRPHPDYLGEGWWHDLDVVIDEAKKNNMKVWLFDDGDYPSGRANGIIEREYPEFLKRYITCSYIDATGPLAGAYFMAGSFVRPQESILRVVAAKRKDRGMEILPETLADVTDCLHGDRLYWDVPDGDWRVFVIKNSPYGEEGHTMGHVNPISKKAVQKYIELIHEVHYAHLGEEFGKTILGFFTDEPRFGNIAGYDRVIGKSLMPLPFTDGLLELLSSRELGDFSKYLPCLWYDAGDVSSDARYLYMDVVTKLFSECFTGQLGDWCRAHGVKLIGHLVEENGAHSRLGYGAGHFFRAFEGLDAGGLDVVCNLYPGQTSGCYFTAFNNFDCDFNHWGLPKMASSTAHIDPKKQNRTMVEAFGAYGWVEGLKAMKWITDALAVRGVNYFVPHAFSADEFPDMDCPPHFYARGHNPQFRNFGMWSNYTNRVCHLLSDGLHIASAAVLYHAEAEWGGKSQPFEKAVRTLMEHQIDTDVLSFDILEDETLTAVEGNALRVNKEHYQTVVVPEMEYLTPSAYKRLKSLAKAGVLVVFLESYPRRLYFGGSFDADGFVLAKTEELAALLQGKGVYDVKASASNPDLCYCHYRKEGADLYFFVNQSLKTAVDCTVDLSVKGTAYLYDAMLDETYDAVCEEIEGGTRVKLDLEPYQTIFVLFGNAEKTIKRVIPSDFKRDLAVDGEWKISVATAEEYPNFRPAPTNSLGNLSAPDLLPAFAGTIRYELTFDAADASRAILDLGAVYELANVTLNGVDLGARICPPYQFVLPEGLLKPTGNVLTAEIINTLAKSVANATFDMYFPQEPSGLLGPVRILY